MNIRPNLVYPLTGLMDSYSRLQQKLVADAPSSDSLFSLIKHPNYLTSNDTEVSLIINDLPTTSPINLGSEDLFPSLPISASNNFDKKIQNSPTEKINTFSNIPNHNPQKTTERFEIPLSLQNKQKDQLGSKLSISDILKNVMKTTKTVIEMSTSSKTGTFTFIVIGLPTDVVSAKRLVQNRITTQVTQTLSVPSSVIPIIIGVGGKNLKLLFEKTMAKINIPRTEPGSDATEEQIVTISGDYEGVEMARAEIESVVAQKTSKKTARLSIERSFHPFICGPNNSNLIALQENTNTKIILAPWATFLSNEAERNLNEVVIKGHQDDVAKAEKMINEIYENLKHTTKMIMLPINKKQHKFIVGVKAAGLIEVMETTGCFVDVPNQSDNSDMVQIRGPEQKIGIALSLVLQMSNSICFEEIDVSPYVSPKNLTMFIKFITGREKGFLKSIEGEHDVLINFPKLPDSVFEFQSKTKPSLDLASAQFKQWVQELGSILFFGVVEIPWELHKFLIGKGGSGIQKIKNNPKWSSRLIDISIPSESEESSQVIIILKKLPELINEANNEAQAFLQTIKESILSHVSLLADLKTITISIKSKYCGKLIGSGGSFMKELLLPYKDNLTARFAANAENDTDNELIVRGPSLDVEKFIDNINQIMKEWSRIDSYSKPINLPKGSAQRLKGNSMLNMSSLANTTREKVANLSKSEKAKIIDSDLNHAYLNMKIDIDESPSNFDLIILSGPEALVNLAFPLFSERVNLLKNEVVIEFLIFDLLSKEAQQFLDESQRSNQIKLKIIKRLAGKDRKNLKVIMDKYNVQITSKNSDIEPNESEPDIPNEIRQKYIITGLKDKAENAKEELLKLCNSQILHSYCETFSIPGSWLSRILGKGGSRLQELQLGTNVYVDIEQSANEELRESVKIEIHGIQEEVLKVKQSILNAIDDLQNTTTSYLKIPGFLQKNILGPNAINIKKIIDKFGGPKSVKIKLARNDDKIIISANLSLIEEIKQEVFNILQTSLTYSKVTSDNFLIDQMYFSKSDISRVIGRGGASLKKLESTYNVDIFIEDLSTNESIIYFVSLPGTEKQIETLKQQIQLKARANEKSPIPNFLSTVMGDQIGKQCVYLFLEDIFKKLKSDAKIHIDFEGTDILIRCEKENLSNSLIETKKICSQIIPVTPLILPISMKFKSHIIGRGGSTINKIRQEADVFLEIYSINKSDYVFIHGSQEKIERSYSMVQQIIQFQKEKDKEELENNKPKSPVEDSKKSESKLKEVPNNAIKTIPGYTPQKKNQFVNPSNSPVELPVSPNPLTTLTLIENKSNEDSWQQVKTRKTKKPESNVPLKDNVSKPELPIKVDEPTLILQNPTLINTIKDEPINAKPIKDEPINSKTIKDEPINAKPIIPNHIDVIQSAEPKNDGWTTVKSKKSKGQNNEEVLVEPVKENNNDPTIKKKKKKKKNGLKSEVNEEFVE